MKKLASDLVLLAAVVVVPAIAAAAEVVRQSCFRCHSSRGNLPEGYQFFEDPESTRAAVRARPRFLETVKYRLEAQEGTRMPLDGALSSEGKEALMKYLNSLQADP